MFDNALNQSLSKKWYESNRFVTNKNKPKRIRALKSLYDIADLTKDRDSLKKLNYIDLINKLNLQSKNQRRAFFQLLKQVAENLKYTHSNRNLTETSLNLLNSKLEEKGVAEFPFQDLYKCRNLISKMAIFPSVVAMESIK